MYQNWLICISVMNWRCTKIGTLTFKGLRKQPKRLSHAGIEITSAECESLYKTFLQSPQEDDSSLAATALFSKLDRKRRDRWSEAVRSIDFLQIEQLNDKKAIISK